MYCPWADLGERHPNVHVDRHDIHPARAAWVSEESVIIIDRRLLADERRVVLAHEIAHIDLGHRDSGIPWFDDRLEREANLLAARRLIDVDELAAALVYCRDDRELAAELRVDIATVLTRRAALSQTERHRIDAIIRTIEHAA